MLLNYKKFTVKDIMEKKPCEEYTEEVFTQLWNNKKSLSLTEISNLDIDIEDRTWILARLVSTETAVKWGRYCSLDPRLDIGKRPYWLALCRATEVANTYAYNLNWNKVREDALKKLLDKLIEMEEEK